MTMQGVGKVGCSYMKRSFTGCVPVLGGQPCPEVCRIGVSYMNQSVTGCVPALSGGLPCPGVGRVSISYMDRLGLAPLRGPNGRCCPGSDVSASAPTVPGYIGLVLLKCPNRRCCPGPGVSASALTDPGSIGVAVQTRPDSSIPPPLRRKENPRSRAPNCSGEGVFIVFITTTICPAGGLPYFPTGDLFPDNLILIIYVDFYQLHALYQNHSSLCSLTIIRLVSSKSQR